MQLEKPGPEDSDTFPVKDDIEKAKMTGDSPLKQAPDEMAINTNELLPAHC